MFLSIRSTRSFGGEIFDTVGEAKLMSARSHSHFDHVGNPSTFPPSTALVVGPGTQAHVRPGYPLNQEASLPESDFLGREVVEITFAEKAADIAGLRSHDYFGDGSFYLLDAPGVSGLFSLRSFLSQRSAALPWTYAWSCSDYTLDLHTYGSRRGAPSRHAQAFSLRTSASAPRLLTTKRPISMLSHCSLPQHAPPSPFDPSRPRRSRVRRREAHCSGRPPGCLRGSLARRRSGPRGWEGGRD
jgi:hypothetical protein